MNGEMSKLLFLIIICGNDYNSARSGMLLDLRKKDLGAFIVKIRRGLVEKKDIRDRGKRHRKANTLLHTGAELPDAPIAASSFRFKPEAREKTGRLVSRDRLPFQLGDELDMLDSGEFGIQFKIRRNETNAFLEIGMLDELFGIRPTARSGRRGKHSANNFEKSRFTGAVRTGDGDNIAFESGETYGIKDRISAEPFRDLGNM